MCEEHVNLASIIMRRSMLFQLTCARFPTRQLQRDARDQLARTPHSLLEREAQSCCATFVSALRLWSSTGGSRCSTKRTRSRTWSAIDSDDERWAGTTSTVRRSAHDDGRARRIGAARRAHPAEPGDRSRAGPGRRGDLQAAADPLSVRGDGLVRANEEFRAWLRGERSMPFGAEQRARHRPADRLRRSRATTTSSSRPRSRSPSAQSSSASTWCCGSTACRSWSARRRRRCGRRSPGSTAPTRSTTTTSATCRAFFVPNVLLVRDRGQGASASARSRMPVQLWAPWRAGRGRRSSASRSVEQAAAALLRPGGRARHPALTSRSSRPTRSTARSRSSRRYQQY